MNTVVRKSRGGASFKQGYAYEKAINALLKTLSYNNVPIQVKDSAGATHGADNECSVQRTSPDGTTFTQSFGIEVKNKGAFEGGCAKLVKTPHGMSIQDDCIQRHILGDQILYDGEILPWYLGKKTLEDWKAVEAIFKPEIKLPTSRDAVADYYRGKGSHYIQLEGKGLYHTGQDILGFGVPKFEATTVLRIRSTKHMKKGISTDITAALSFERASLPNTPYSLDGVLPPCLTKR